MAITKQQEKELIDKVKEGQIPRKAAIAMGLDLVDFRAFRRENPTVFRRVKSVPGELKRLRERERLIAVEMALIQSSIKELEGEES